MFNYFSMILNFYYYKQVDKVAGTGYSKIDSEMVNTYKYPQIGKTGWKWTTLKPGDCIFIPAGNILERLFIF